MTHSLLVTLQAGHAFNPAPRRDELYALHVPFDELTSTTTCEAALHRALQQRHRVALVGISGSGKSSVTEQVLGPLAEGLAPLPIPVSVENPAIATDPVAFAGHLVALIRRWVQSSSPTRAGRAAAIATTHGARTQKFSAAPEWMGAKLELAYELSQAAAPPATSSTEVLEQARQLIDLITADELTPVLVLDDTDRWLAASWQPDSGRLRAAFFGRVIQVLAEDLSTAAVVAVHPTYLADPDYQAAAGFIDTTIHVPPLTTPEAVGRVLGRRIAQHLDLSETQALDDLIEKSALQMLFYHYQHAPDVRRRILQVAHMALTVAVDAGAPTLNQAHVRSALTETFAPE